MYAQMTDAAADTEAGSNIVDLRSDTVTKPDAGMRRAMSEARVGDDVYGEDPTARELEERTAALLGKPAGVFFPTGTQSNLAAILAHCGRGDEIIVGDRYHSFHDEAGGASVLGGVALCPIGTGPDGSLDPGAIEAAVKPDDSHYACSRLLCLENTVSGAAVPLAKMQAAADVGRAHGLAVHLDGARLFNAVTALDVPAAALAEVADTVSICLSKGLGTPAGTVLVGDEKTMKAARRNRKILGGAMRQVGVLAAAGLYALDHHIAGLAEDHRRAKALAEALSELPALARLSARQATNMVFVTPAPADHGALRRFLTDRGILIGGQVPEMRIVLHRDIRDGDVEAVIEAVRAFYADRG